MNKYYLLCTNPQYIEEAYKLAKFTDMLEVRQNSNEPLLENHIPYLLLDDKGLAIQCQHFKPLYTYEIYTNLKGRKSNILQELIIQTIKIKNKAKDQVTILDLTAGFGKDSNLIASFGYNVIMVERNPVLATIIYHAILHNYFNNNVQIIYMDSIDYLESFNSLLPIDAIYLDPMFEQDKSSKAKKEMQIIDNIISTFDTLDNSFQSNARLFKLAQNITKKIIIKRDNKQKPLIDNPKPSYSKLGKTIRYDVYQL
ncbi:MAG: class I SAM-dependent methyltransferase [Neisseriaceae bacterium]